MSVKHVTGDDKEATVHVSVEFERRFELRDESVESVI